eukprot:CAMPEP_0194401392 /NCGR_PEP_ID=MMETSP0174-20130528/127784_1 /TAXON_ID=216777 /ORGANISM="Proboscia alata, Strain PI-D3" /LENGTH=142 /DNA_ID=CAMNT_0039198095 /DNA_START=534 /DNA_END=958 /DNA_ORIENTATION=-
MNERILKIKAQKRMIELENEMRKKAKIIQATSGGTDSSSGLVVVSAGITTARPLCTIVLQSGTESNDDIRLLSDVKARIQRSLQWRLNVPSMNPTDEQLKRAEEDPSYMGLITTKSDFVISTNENGVKCEGDAVLHNAEEEL